jgi:hypothetical protein
VLAELLWHHQENQNKAAALSAFDAVLAAMRRHAVVAAVQVAGHRALNSFTYCQDVHKQAASDAGAIELILPALRSQQDPRALGSACCALGNIVRIPALAIRAGKLGAVEAVVAVMRAHPVTVPFHFEGCYALHALVQGCASNMTKAHRGGVADLARSAAAAALLHPPDSSDLVLAAPSKLLELLSASWERSTAAADAAAAELLAAEEAERVARMAAALPAKCKSKKKRGGNTRGSAGASGSAAEDGETADSTDAVPDAPEPEPVAAPHADANTSAAGDSGAGMSYGAGGAELSAPATSLADASFSADAHLAQPPAQPVAPRGAPRPYRPPVGGRSPLLPPASSCGMTAALLQPPPQHDAAAGASLLAPLFSGLALGASQAVAPAPAVPVEAAAPPPPPPPPPPPTMRECCVCFADVPPEDLLLLWPCAHRCVCQACADALLATQPAAERRCPKCRVRVRAASRVFEDV